MGLSLKTEFEYIPKFNGNDESKSPAVFKIMAMGAIEFRAWADELRKAAGDGELTPAARKVYADLVRGHVVVIKGMDIDGVAIPDGAALVENPGVPNALLTEIERAILDGSNLSKDEAKN